MKLLGISNLRNRCYRELSGGQQQRVLLARALCATRKMLLLDEPVSGLDPNATLQMYELIRELNSMKITIIMVSHDIAAAVRYASHILHIGDTVFFGTTQEYMNSETGQFFLQYEEEDMLKAARERSVQATTDAAQTTDAVQATTDAAQVMADAAQKGARV